MQLQQFLRRACLPAVAVAAVALVRWLSDRGLFGESRVDPQQSSSDIPTGFFVAVIIILGAVALAGQLYDSRWAALGWSVIAGVAINAYSIAADWLHAGWGGLIMHDTWFGDQQYWVLVGLRGIIVVVTFAIVVTVTWGIARRAHTHQAG
jgi:hypothetical protein